MSAPAIHQSASAVVAGPLGVNQAATIPPVAATAVATASASHLPDQILPSSLRSRLPARPIPITPWLACTPITTLHPRGSWFVVRGALRSPLPL